MHRKYPNVSIIKIRETLRTKDWNNFLFSCYIKKDVECLKRTLYGIQADMADLTKMGVDSNELLTLFLRLQTSIEKCARKIFTKMYPCSLDDSKNNLDIKRRLAVKSNLNTSAIDYAKIEFKKSVEAKRKRDAEFNQFIKDSKF